MSIPRFELDKATPLDTKTAIGFFGSADSYYGLLERYEEVSMINDLKGCAKAVNELDYKEVKERIHSMKGASAYAGASRVTDHCYWMQYHFEQGDNQKMMDLYPRLIESVVQFRVWHRKVIAERKGETYQINPEHETCPIADGYKITKIRDYEYKCEKVDDNEDEEEIEQLDKDEEAEQENQQAYLRSQEDALRKQQELEVENEKKLAKARQEAAEAEQKAAEAQKKAAVIDKDVVRKAKKKIGRKTQGENNDSFDNDVHIDLQIEKRADQTENAANK